MKTNELNRREFIARAAKSYLGVGLMPLVGSYIHDNAYALTPGARPAIQVRPRWYRSHLNLR